ncbi:Kae1-associated serine/threonine protein kinase [Candidatus Bathyarchaeota archaeon]|nr:Kae1-associated serine/threonine protein kinase [Candidatus Bathyarchaeota archaeon]
MVLIKKGAEANLYLEEWHGIKVIVKQRLQKMYRHPVLDMEIRRFRTAHEAELLHYAKVGGVPTPTIYLIDMMNTTIIMQYIIGEQVKRVLDKLDSRSRVRLSVEIGKLVGRLHQRGIIHGDLTTSNIILTPSGKIYFIDFGLGEYSTEVEARGVDLHLMRRALQSTHYRLARECFPAILNGYSMILGENTAEEVWKRVREIEKRGRYVTER